MDKFTIYCTEEQTKKALELGAPITTRNDRFDERVSPICKEGEQWLYAIIPTAEQMLGWLEEQGILIDIDTEWNKSVLVYVWDCENKSPINNVFHGSRKEATLAAIDAALEYLIKTMEE